MGTEREKHKLPPGDEAMFGYLHAELSHFLLQNLHDLIVIRGKKNRVLRGKGGSTERDGEMQNQSGSHKGLQLTLVRIRS